MGLEQRNQGQEEENQISPQSTPPGLEDVYKKLEQEHRERVEKKTNPAVIDRETREAVIEYFKPSKDTSSPETPSEVPPGTPEE